MAEPAANEHPDSLQPPRVRASGDEAETELAANAVPSTSAATPTREMPAQVSEPAAEQGLMPTEHFDRLAVALGFRADASGECVVPHPDQIGDYKILAVLGEGGMGVVYRAQQQHPKRLVALKVVRPSLLGARAMRRFELEAEVLGRLEHPSIARIYEAGTAQTDFGLQPFFAMELVQGRPLSQYAHEERLPLRRRLELLAKVCDAVQYAHQNGVIHRDLKSSNILVTDDGQPKVLDFGVARITDADVQAVTLQTETGQIVGTLPYMSPEQAAGDARNLDTRSDVYALGVIGYELLAGRLPLDLRNKPLVEAVRIIREEEPGRLSSIDRSLRGDVETILSNAQEKEKSRRYGSAADLAADIRRHLHSEPITARPPGTWYQLSRFARRNKTLVSGIAATFLALAAGLAIAAYQAVRATHAEQRISGEQVRTLAEKHVAERERQRADEQRILAKRQTAGSLIAGGFKDLEGGDPSSALLQFVRDLRIEEVDAPDAERAIAARYRIGMTLPRVPRPLDIAAPLPRRIADSGMQVVTFEQGKVFVREVGTGRMVCRINSNGPFSQVARTADGRRIATVVGREIQFWNAATGESDAEPISTGMDGEETVKLGFSPDGRRVALLGDYIRVWDVRTRARITGALPHARAVNTFEFSPNSRWLATGSNDSLVRIWDLDSSQPASKPWNAAMDLKHRSGYVLQLAFSQDGSQLISTTFPDHSAWVWDISALNSSAGTAQGRLLAGPLQHDSDLSQLALSPDGMQALTATANDIVRVWDTETGRPLSGAMRHTSMIQVFGFDPDDSRIVFTTHSGPPPDYSPVQLHTRAWDAAAAEPASLVLRHADQVLLGSFSRDGKYIVTAGRDSRSRVWDAETGSAVGLPLQFSLWNFKKEPILAQYVQDAAFSPDGRRIAIAAAHAVCVYDTATARLISRLNKPVSEPQWLLPTVRYSPDGRWLVSSAQPAKEAWVWDPENGEAIGAPLTHDGPCIDAWISPDGRTIATATEDSTGAWIHLWDAATRQRRAPRILGPASHNRRPCFDARTAAAFSPDSRFIATSCTTSATFPTPAFPEHDHPAATAPADPAHPARAPRCLIQVWDVQTCRLAMPPISLDVDPKGETTALVAFSADGRRLVCAVGEVVWVLNVATARAIAPPLTHRGIVWDACFSPDGRLIATASDDKTARIWDVTSGLPVSPPLVHRMAVYDVDFSPDGRRLITSSGDCTARVWNVNQDKRPLIELERLAELLASRQMNANGGLSPLPAGEWDRRWEALRKQEPEQFRPLPPPPPIAVEVPPAYTAGLDAMYQERYSFAQLASGEMSSGLGAQAIAAAERAMEFKSENTSELYQAMGYLLTNRFDRAEQILRARRNERFGGGQKTFGMAALETIERLQQLGVARQQLYRAEHLLQSPAPATAPATQPLTEPGGK